jgi:hypothetical protein
MSEQPTTEGISFQSRVWAWVLDCFKRADARLPEQRAFRFIEEALELVQAIGTSKEDVHRLVNYTYSRPPGEFRQEMGGVMVTLAALAESTFTALEGAGEAELRRCILNTAKIRAKDLAKPERSPLPGFSGEPGELQRLRELVVEAFPVMNAHAARHIRKADNDRSKETWRTFHQNRADSSSQWLDKAGAYYNAAQSSETKAGEL